MDPFKIILFFAAFAALLLIGRMLSRASEVHAASLPHPEPQPGSNPQFVNTPVGSRIRQTPALIGAEIPFPIQIPPVQQREDGSYNRPEILNYYFAKTDLLRGPEDPDALFDELTIEARDRAHHSPIYYSYIVATPSGLRQAMDQEKLASLYLDRMPVVIVPRWDLALILNTVVDEIMKVYGSNDDEEPPERAISHPSF